MSAGGGVDHAARPGELAGAGVAVGEARNGGKVWREGESSIMLAWYRLGQQQQQQKLTPSSTLHLLEQPRSESAPSPTSVESVLEAVEQRPAVVILPPGGAVASAAAVAVAAHVVEVPAGPEGRKGSASRLSVLECNWWPIINDKSSGKINNFIITNYANLFLIGTVSGEY